MRQYKQTLLHALLLSIFLLGSGVSEAGNQYPATTHDAYKNREDNKSHKNEFSAQISFGDSLSDVGTYAVGTVAALGGGQFTVNSPGVKNWTAVMAEQFELSAPCAAQTGLDGDATQGFSVPVVNHAGCTGYAQGGARVTSPIGIGNKLTGGANATIGFLTVPVVQQIQNHLNANAGKFSDDDIVFIMVGANDVFYQLGLLQAQYTDPTGAVTAMAQAASELVTAINTKVVANGAKHVVVLNIPNIAITPLGATFVGSTRGLLDYMVNTFNGVLKSGVAGNDNVLYVDAYTESYYQYINPGAYGLTNVTNTACDLSPAKNPLSSSLVCTSNNLIPGITGNYLFSDMVHPTPYGYGLIARLVSNEMANRGWRFKHKKND
jgi:phospholipase/lecithinase/hemolysin